MDFQIGNSYSILLLVVFVTVQASNSEDIESLAACDSAIFCYGDLLEAAQHAYIYNDSKSFVDMKLMGSPDVVLDEFEKLRERGNLSDPEVKMFVEENFSEPGSEFVDWVPGDWKESPAFISQIADKNLLTWAKELNALWKVLGRKIVDDVFTNSSLYSLIPVANPVIVPGGRFREFYYWDTYWVIRGLLLSEMHETVRGMLENFLELVEIMGFIPNGGRIYYQRRSQPPFLIPMMDAYVDATNDTSFLRDSLPILKKEYNFWIENRSVKVNEYTLNVYSTEVNLPRPESYREDSEDIKDLSNSEGKLLMQHITSACESGWDFSSRWAGSNYSLDVRVIRQLKTRDIIPVDLNSILAWNERLLAEFYRKMGILTLLSIDPACSVLHCKLFTLLSRETVEILHSMLNEASLYIALGSVITPHVLSQHTVHYRASVEVASSLYCTVTAKGQKLSSLYCENKSEALKYDEKYSMRLEAIENVLWNEEDGTYYDYEISTKTQNKKFFASNLNPLWTKCFSKSVDIRERENRLFHYLQKTGVLNYPGGVPTSLEASGEQWDFPNAWPPLVHMIIEGMATSMNETLQNEAFMQAQKWINSNYKAYAKTEAMFEKYDVTATDGVPGSGGEYDVQVGFGWTNGVIMTFLDRYAQKAKVEEVASTTSIEMTTSTSNRPSSHQLSSIVLSILLCIVLL